MSAKSYDVTGGAFRAAGRAFMLVLSVAGLAGVHVVHAAAKFPDVPLWSMVGAFQDSSHIPGQVFRCVGSFRPRPDSLRRDSRSVSVRFLRDRNTEARPDFGGYRIYRMTNAPDSSQAILVRRFSLNAGSEITWNFSRVTRTSTVSQLLGDGTGAFPARTELSSGLLPTAVTSADLDGDGNPDLIIANQGANSLSLMFGNGTGGLSRRAEFPLGFTPSDVAVADVNRDGKPDLVVATAAARDLVVILADPLGGFIAPQSTPVRSGPSALAVGDLNNDNVPDFAVACSGSDTVAVVLGRPNGFGDTFGATFFIPVGPRPVALAMGDVTGDGTRDLVVVNAGNNTVSVLKGLGSGDFTPIGLLTTTGTGAAGVALRDVNGDGNLDLMVTNSGSKTASLWFGNGTGGFVPEPDLPTDTGPRGILATDLDGDGKVDVAVANEGAGSVWVWHGDGLGVFRTTTISATGTGPRALAAVDFNKDGRQDLFTADFSFRLPYVCNGGVVNDSILTFVDPDSTGRFVKVCRLPQPPNGRCLTPGDSVFALVPPPGPHDGFLTWYSITIERKNTTDPDYEDLFVPDTLDNFARCSDPTNRNTCPNLNHKLRNLTGPSEPTAGPTENLESVLAVPNPYRGHEVWDQPGQSEVHFTNLPPQATIKIYTAAGDLVREIRHSDTVHDFERWDLKNASGQAVASGIYVYRIEAGLFHFQSRLVVIR